jgi:hypothetical protein
MGQQQSSSVDVLSQVDTVVVKNTGRSNSEVWELHMQDGTKGIMTWWIDPILALVVSGESNENLEYLLRMYTEVFENDFPNFPRVIDSGTECKFEKLCELLNKSASAPSSTVSENCNLLARLNSEAPHTNEIFSTLMRYNYLVLEPEPETTFEAYTKTTFKDDKSLWCCIFQIIATIHYLQERRICHGNLDNENNIRVRICNTPQTLKYTIAGKEYHIETRNVIVICGFQDSYVVELGKRQIDYDIECHDRNTFVAYLTRQIANTETLEKFSTGFAAMDELYQLTQ